MTGLAARYETLLPIGTGGMATVYIGRAHGSSHFVALKRAHPHIRADETLTRSMKTEARLASRLQHANVVSVLDVDEDNGDLVLVLDYIEGCTLRTLINKIERLGERRAPETIRIILDVAAGLHAAHQATDEHGRLLGLVHRDISPSNVLVGIDGVSRISDFGIAKALFERSDRTETGVLKGKTSYMAPEYVLHQHANAASDLFSLAVVAWEALAGTRLFKGANDIETLERVARADVRPLSERRPELACLDLVLAKALSRRPSDRHSSVDRFAAELEAVARRNDLVASHSEVSALVKRVARPELEERHRALRREAETVVATIPLGVRQEDDLATAVMSSDHERVGPPSLARASPRAPGESHPRVDSRSRVEGPSLPRLERLPSTPRLSTRSPSSRSAPSHRGRRRARLSEKIALAASLAFLALAVTMMMLQLRNATAIDDSAAAAPARSSITRPDREAEPLDGSAAAPSSEPAAGAEDADAVVAPGPSTGRSGRHPPPPSLMTSPTPTNVPKGAPESARPDASRR